MPKPKLPPELQETLGAARRSRVEQAAHNGSDPRQHRDAGLISAADMDALVADYAEARRGRQRRPEDIEALRAKIAKRAARARNEARRGQLLHRYNPATLGELFGDDELAALLLQNADAQEQRAAVRERHLERQEVATMTRQVEREREQEARRAAEAEARERLGVEG